ncbi:MAG: uracil-DNA glycosylase [Christensenellales bacterium]|jgi:uracil-DNA glycosylase family 4
MISWPVLLDKMKDCSLCSLCEGRRRIVLGEGDYFARLMLVGEGPGAQEDRLGRPFVGPAGQLLDKMLAAIGLSREQVYIANIVKCRPPGNRAPTDEEAAACLPYLRSQVALIQPALIVCLGATAARHIIDPQLRITRDRGVWVQRKNYFILPTYHPAALLRDAGKKREAWEDFKAIRDKLAQLEQEGGRYGQ